MRRALVAMLFDQFLNDDGLSHSSAAEQPDLARPCRYGSIRSTTLIPVSNISRFVFCRPHRGRGFVNRISSLRVMRSHLSTGSPITLITRPNTALAGRGPTRDRRYLQAGHATHPSASYVACKAIVANPPFAEVAAALRANDARSGSERPKPLLRDMQCGSESAACLPSSTSDVDRWPIICDTSSKICHFL